MAQRSNAASTPTPTPVPARTHARGTQWLRDGTRAHQRSIGIATAVVAFLLIVRITLKANGLFLPDHVDLCIICGDKGTADFILNVLLFVPLGFGLRLGGVRRRTVAAVAVLFTITIETLQYYVVPGRESGLNDIVSNSTGGFLGIALADAIGMLLAPAPAAARRLALGAALGWCAVAAGTQWLLQPALPSTVYYEQVAANLPQFARFDGVVLDASFNGQPFHSGRMSPESSATLRAALLAGDARLVARVLPGHPTQRAAPIMSVFDRHRSEIFVLARRHNDVVFRLRRRSQDLGFLPLSLTLAHVFAPQPADSQSVMVTATVQPTAIGLTAARVGAERESRLGSGVWQGWRLFLPDEAWYGDFPRLFTATWMIMLCVPMGYWAGCSARERGVAIAAVPPVVALLTGLAIIPWVASALTAPWPVWAAGVAAVASAWGVARWIDA
jgi:VanZ family protein